MLHAFSTKSLDYTVIPDATSSEFRKCFLKSLKFTGLSLILASISIAIMVSKSNAADLKLNYSCSFAKVLVPADMLCSTGIENTDGTFHASQTIVTRKVNGHFVFKVTTISTLPVVTCGVGGITVGGTSIKRLNAKVRVEKRSIRIIDPTIDALVLKLPTPLHSSTKATFYTNRGSLLASGCDSCRVPITGQCTKTH